MSHDCFVLIYGNIELMTVAGQRVLRKEEEERDLLLACQASDQYEGR